MTRICKRLRRVLRLSLLFSLPCFLIDLAAQGYKEFRPEIEAGRKYRIIIRKLKGKDR